MRTTTPDLLPPSTAEVVCRSRRVERMVVGSATSDGAGVKLTRVLTQPLQRRLDPFLMLDAFRSDDPDDYIGGFPDHPHRGFETITYMLAGRMRHRDSAGNQGLLESGGVQWMTAGRGVIHSELPEQQDGLMEGFQLWLNLPARDKMAPAWYRDLPDAALPRFVTPSGARVKVIAGASHGVQAPVTREATAPLYLDIDLPPGADFAHALAADLNAFVYVFRGQVEVGGSVVPSGRMAILANEPGCDGVVLRGAEPVVGAQREDGVGTEAGGRLLLIAGRPLGEPIVQYGPFVMNSEAEIYQAVDDYRAGRLG
ncbi:MAG: pirin family protein [Rhodocyclaceae bacterium]